MDPMLPLAFSIQSGPGVYALLLGSGVSRDAGIPTGWEVTLDLIARLSAAVEEREEAVADPAGWYRLEYGEEPDYSRVVNNLSATPAERRQLLERYFEPSMEEREEGKKLPTEAHHAIARLAARGYVKVILTTNFDKLMEKALEAAGVTPTVISTPDATKGARPLQHTRCTVIKINGDYLDARIKNTPAELAEYDPRMDTLLDKVFDEYGLLVCGWSGEYDTALREAFKRSRSRRFTTYWASRGEPGERAKELVEFAGGRLVEIESADRFFRDLIEKVESLEEYGGDHPLTAELAVATAKRYLAEDRHRIRLEDLVKRETERLYEGLFLADTFPAGEATSITETGFRSRVESYGRLTEVLLAVMIVGCYWDEKQRGQLWASCLERIANPPAVGGALPYVELRRYPALLLMYGGGIASITGDRYETLTTLLYRARVRRQSEEYPLTLALNTRSFPSGLGWMNSYLQLDRSPDQRVNFFRPFSENLYQALRGPLHEMLPDEANYQKYFDRFEYLLGLVYVDQRKEHMPDYSGREGYGPIGLFGYRRQQPEGHRVLEEIASEAESLREEWPPLRAGLFGYSYERYRVAKDAFNAFVEEETSGW